MAKSISRDGLQKMAGLSIFTAVIALLTVLCTFIRFGPFSITLALTPVIIGGAVYGMKAGTYLGGVFGFVVLLTGIFGWDGGTVMLLMGQNALGCIAICLGKGMAAGWASAVVYKLLEKKSGDAASGTAAILCPVVNTGLFILGNTDAHPVVRNHEVESCHILAGCKGLTSLLHVVRQALRVICVAVDFGVGGNQTVNAIGSIEHGILWGISAFIIPSAAV